MSNTRRIRQIKAAAASNTAHTAKNDHSDDTGDDKRYVVGLEKASIDEKLSIIEELGKPELIDIFKGWAPRVSNRKKRGAPLDQRVSITVTTQERVLLDQELKAVKETGDKISMSQFIRNRALGTVDINGWRERAEEALKEIEDTVNRQAELRTEKLNTLVLMDEEDDEDVATIYSMQAAEIDKKLNKLVAQNEKRNNRLSGRMSMAEAETIKWRAQRLCLSSSDYLRMMIFSLEPDSKADSHMSLDAKRRFYISVIDVARNGWGTPPSVYECSQCMNYMEEIRRLREENEQIRQFL